MARTHHPAIKSVTSNDHKTSAILKWTGTAKKETATQAGVVVGSIEAMVGPLGISYEMTVRGKRIGQCGGGSPKDAKKRAREMVEELVSKGAA